MKKYTTKIHVERLKKMLKRKNLELNCPANWRFCAARQSGKLRYDFELIELWDLKKGPHPCDTCSSFVGLREKDPCPCDVFGPRKAREITEQKIKEWEEEND